MVNVRGAQLMEEARVFVQEQIPVALPLGDHARWQSSESRQGFPDRTTHASNR